MTDLLDYIDLQIKSCIGEARMFGLCHLVEDDSANVYPSTFQERAEKVSPDNRFLITIYHRLLDGNLDAREDISFGRTMTAQNAQKIRTVVFIKMSEGHSKIDDIVNSLPDSFEVDGYQFANVSKSISLDRNQKAVWEAEYGEAYQDKMIKQFLVYALEYDLQYIKCNACV